MGQIAPIAAPAAAPDAIAPVASAILSTPLTFVPETFAIASASE